MSVKSSIKEMKPSQCACHGDRKKRWERPALDAGDSVFTTMQGEDSVLMAPSIASQGSMLASSYEKSIDRTDKKNCSCYGNREDRQHGLKPAIPKQPKNNIIIKQNNDSVYSSKSKEDDKPQTKCRCGAGGERFNRPSPTKINRSKKPRKLNDSLDDDFGSIMGRSIDRGSLGRSSVDSAISNTRSCGCRGHRANRIRYADNNSIARRN